MRSAAHRVELSYEILDRDDRWLLEEGSVPESPLHDAIILLLVEILIAWKLREHRDASVVRNIAVRWQKAFPRQGVDPDVSLIEPALPPRATSLCTWKAAHNPPRVGVEIVSENTAEKDYTDGPDRYAASGTRELWVFDPLLVGPADHGGPFVLQVWRRDRTGRFRRIYAGEGPARSVELGAWLVVTDAGMRLRIANDEAGTSLWLTEAEASRADADAAEAEVARLRAEISRLRGK